MSPKQKKYTLKDLQNKTLPFYYKVLYVLSKTKKSLSVWEIQEQLVKLGLQSNINSTYDSYSCQWRKISGATSTQCSQKLREQVYENEGEFSPLNIGNYLFDPVEQKFRVCPYSGIKANYSHYALSATGKIVADALFVKPTAKKKVSQKVVTEKEVKNMVQDELKDLVRELAEAVGLNVY